MTESPDFTCSVYKINPASSTRQHLLAASTMYSTHWLRQYQVPARTMSESFPWLHPVCHILSPLLAPPSRGRAQHEHYTRIRGPRGVGELGTHDCKSAEKTVLQSNKRVCRKQARAFINTSVSSVRRIKRTKLRAPVVGPEKLNKPGPADEGNVTYSCHNNHTALPSTRLD